MTDVWDAEATIRAALVTRVQTVTDIGNVYGRHRFCDNWRDFKDLFGFTPTGETTPILRTWFVSCEIVPIAGLFSAGSFGGGIQTTLDYRVRGYLGVVDASNSEQAGLVLAIKVQKALNNNATLAATAYNASLAQLTYQYATWGGVLCHFAEISIPFQLGF